MVSFAHLYSGRIAAHGGDWGALIAHTLASRYPSECVAVHITFIIFPPPTSWNFPLVHLKFLMSMVFGAERTYGHEEAKRLERLQTIMKTEMGYFHVQTTKPQSLAYGLNDSPIGLLGMKLWGITWVSYVENAKYNRVF